jgi:hypothetical protein
MHPNYPVFMSHSHTVLSKDPEAISSLLGETATVLNGNECPFSVPRNSHVFVSHSRTVVPLDPDAIKLAVRRYTGVDRAYPYPQQGSHTPEGRKRVSGRLEGIQTGSQGHEAQGNSIKA